MRREKILSLLFMLLILIVSCILHRAFKYQGFGIALYATNRQYLCNALINVARLRSFATKVEIVILLPASFLEAPRGTPTQRLITSILAYGVLLETLDLEQSGLRSDDVTYEHSLQKLEILRLSHKRLLYFDTDGLILRNPDSLFFEAPEADLLLPEAYYASRSVAEDEVMHSSALMLIKPSPQLYNTAQKLVRYRQVAEFDMEIFQKLTQLTEYSTSTLAYRHNLLLTGVFRDHKSYSRNESWYPQGEWEKALYIHFSDDPIPKPWIDDRGATYAQHGPKCPAGGQDCAEVRIWRQIYNDFKDEMRQLCPNPKELDLWMQ